MKDNWDNNWSEYIKSTLEDYQAPVPDKLWDNLNNQLGKPKKASIINSKLFTYLLSGITIFTIAYFLYKSDTSIDSEKNSQMTKVAKTKSVAVNNPPKKILTDEFKLKTFNSNVNNKITSAQKEMVSLNNFDAHFKEELQSNKKVHLEPLKRQFCKHMMITSKLPITALKPIQAILTSNIKQKKRFKTKTNFGIGAGFQSINSWNAYTGAYGEFRVNKFGVYGGLYYNPNQLNKITKGDGADDTTESVLTATGIQHRLSFSFGLNYTLFKTTNKHIFINAGIISKSLSLNGNKDIRAPLLMNTGLEFRIPVLKTDEIGIYYNYLFNPSSKNKKGHQVGIKILLKGSKIK